MADFCNNLLEYSRLMEMEKEVIFTSKGSVAEVVERLIEETVSTIDAALYRFNYPRLARALQSAAQRGVLVRLVLDRNKFEESKTTRELLTESHINCRVTYGLDGKGSKMHHKFVIVDSCAVLTGSYNWTSESELQNYDNLMILRSPGQVEAFSGEFAGLWAGAAPAD
jgi:phosphatidylserine/phosphatidylglycerophosphate/cardiolipin synthase-like enzyme